MTDEEQPPPLNPAQTNHKQRLDLPSWDYKEIPKDIEEFQRLELYLSNRLPGFPIPLPTDPRWKGWKPEDLFAHCVKTNLNEALGRDPRLQNNLIDSQQWALVDGFCRYIFRLALNVMREEGPNFRGLRRGSPFSHLKRKDLLDKLMAERKFNRGVLEGRNSVHVRRVYLNDSDKPFDLESATRLLWTIPEQDDDEVGQGSHAAQHGGQHAHLLAQAHYPQLMQIQETWPQGTHQELQVQHPEPQPASSYQRLQNTPGSQDVRLTDMRSPVQRASQTSISKTSQKRKHQDSPHGSPAGLARPSKRPRTHRPSSTQPWAHVMVSGPSGPVPLPPTSGGQPQPSQQLPRQESNPAANEPQSRQGTSMRAPAAQGNKSQPANRMQMPVEVIDVDALDFVPLPPQKRKHDAISGSGPGPAQTVMVASGSSVTANGLGYGSSTTTSALPPMKKQKVGPTQKGNSGPPQRGRKLPMDLPPQPQGPPSHPQNQTPVPSSSSSVPAARSAMAIPTLPQLLPMPNPGLAGAPSLEQQLPLQLLPTFSEEQSDAHLQALLNMLPPSAQVPDTASGTVLVEPQLWNLPVDSSLAGLGANGAPMFANMSSSSTNTWNANLNPSINGNFVGANIGQTGNPRMVAPVARGPVVLPPGVLPNISRSAASSPSIAAAILSPRLPQAQPHKATNGKAPGYAYNVAQAMHRSSPRPDARNTPAAGSSSTLASTIPNAQARTYPRRAYTNSAAATVANTPDVQKKVLDVMVRAARLGAELPADVFPWAPAVRAAALASSSTGQHNANAAAPPSVAQVAQASTDIPAATTSASIVMPATTTTTASTDATTVPTEAPEPIDWGTLPWYTFEAEASVGTIPDPLGGLPNLNKYDFDSHFLSTVGLVPAVDQQDVFSGYPAQSIDGYPPPWVGHDGSSLFDLNLVPKDDDAPVLQA